MTKVKNYRGISLLNTCYKIFTKFIVKRISKIIEDELLDSYRVKTVSVQGELVRMRDLLSNFQ